VGYVKLHKVAFVLLIVGGLNWGLEAFGWGIESWIPLPSSVFQIIYILVGLSAVYEVASHKKLCRDCDKKMGAM
jgi:uncharacterized membrane protein YuzA (DUF378 family)